MGNQKFVMSGRKTGTISSVSRLCILSIAFVCQNEDRNIAAFCSFPQALMYLRGHMNNRKVSASELAPPNDKCAPLKD